MSLRQRIFLALAANAFGQFVTIGSQILLTPLYFSAWGAAKYGEWLILSTIPAYLIMADFGVGSAAGNEMTMRAGAGDREGAQRTFRGALWINSLVSLGVMAVSIVAAYLSWQLHIPNTRYILPHDVAILLLIFGLGVSLNFFLGVISAGFRCCGKNATGIFLSNSSRLLEILAAGLMLWANYSPVYVCLTGFLIKLLAGGVQAIWLRTLCPWLLTPRYDADRTLMKRLIKPSLAFLAFPMGNALALQGPILILGAVFGSAPVAIFSAMRTLSRVPFQITVAFNSSIWPEMSLAYGSGDMALLRRLHRKSWLLTVSLVLFSAAGIALCGKWIVSIWLGKHGVYDGLILNGLLAVSVMSAIWAVSAVVLAAVNAHAKIAIYYVLINGIGLILLYFITLYFGMQGFIFELFLVEVAMTLVVFPRVLAISNDDLISFIKWIKVSSLRIFGYRAN